jgi:hypothetical protein
MPSGLKHNKGMPQFLFGMDRKHLRKLFMDNAHG